MVFLINCSNLKSGGGLQVAHSICSLLGRFPHHKFIIVLSSYIRDFEIENGDNCRVFRYNIKNSFETLLFGRDAFLDRLVKEFQVDSVLTVFGPSRWRPRCRHLCGFARAQLLLDNPLEKTRSVKTKFQYGIWKWGFKKSSKFFYTENESISEKLPGLLGDVTVYTVTNYYNQIFDQVDKWKYSIKLPDFDGVTLLTISTPSPHKNLQIMIPIAEYLEHRYPDFKFRFVLTCGPEDILVPSTVENHFVFIGKVDISECPFLYKQADIMFMPTLLECFSATYPEAMRMGVPIITTDLSFAHGLCGDAAYYYSATDSIAAANAIVRVSTDASFSESLVANGKVQLRSYDNYQVRVEKLIGILETIANTV